MKIEASTVTKLLITELIDSEFRLDLVTVFIEDLGLNGSTSERVSNRGKIIIECYGKSWSSYWGAMGDRTLAEFFCDCNANYLIGCFAPQLHATRFSGAALVKLAKKTIISRRQGWRHRDHEYGYLDAEECRKLYDQTDELSGVDTVEQAVNWHSDLIGEIFETTEAWYPAGDATEPNPDYQYLCRIIGAVQAALRSLVPVEVAA